MTTSMNNQPIQKPCTWSYLVLILLLSHFCLFQFVDALPTSLRDSEPFINAESGDHSHYKPIPFKPVDKVCDASIANSKKQQGKTLDLCSSSSECGASLQCGAVLFGDESDKFVSCEEAKGSEKEDILCLCRPTTQLESDERCKSASSSCPTGQSCGIRKSGSDKTEIKLSFCASNEMTLECFSEVRKQMETPRFRQRYFRHKPFSKACNLSKENAGKRKGKSFDICTKSSECSGQNMCGALNMENPREFISCEKAAENPTDKVMNGDKLFCFCRPPKTMEKDSRCKKTPGSCPSGEACGLRKQGSSSIDKKLSTCVSSEMNSECYKEIEDQIKANLLKGEDSEEPSPEPSSESEKSSEKKGVCIGVHHLTDLKEDELVFAKHQTSRVLCDENRNCATPGHIVIYMNKPMMMKTYCDAIGDCNEEIMKVNSPSWSRGRRIKSYSNHLEFTAHAAKYETPAEEHILKNVIRAESWALWEGLGL